MGIQRVEKNENKLPGAWEERDGKMYPLDNMARVFYWTHGDLTFLWQPEGGRRTLDMERSRWHENRHRLQNG